MSNERDLIAARDAASARLRRVIDPQRRSSSSAANGGGTAAGGRTRPIERWKDGTAVDKITRLEEEIDEPRFHADNEYQSRPDVLAKMSVLTKLRYERDSKNPPPTPGPTQQEYEKNREQIIADAKKAVIDRDIERRIEQRKSMETVK